MQQYTLAFFLITLLLFISSIVRSEQSIAKRINFGELPSEKYADSNESCILKSYWHSILGNNIASNKQLADCSECKSNEIESRYYCFLIKAGNYFWMGEYEAVSRVYYSMANDSTLSQLEDAQLQSILTIANNYESTVISNKNEDLTVVINADGKFVSHINNIEYILDTGAVFGSAPKSLCASGESKHTEIMLYTGDVLELGSCNMKYLHNQSLPVVFSEEYLLGQAFIRSYNKVIFSNKKPVQRKILYKDGTLLFYLIDFELNGVIYKRNKACLDSGALISTFMPSVFNKVKTHIAELPLKKVNMKTPFGNYSALGKELIGVKLFTSQEPILLKSAPVFISNVAFNQCDIVLGHQEIEKLVVAIDYQNSKILLH